MATENKEVLIKTIGALEAEVVSLKKEIELLLPIKKEFEANKSLKDEAIHREFSLRKEKDALSLLLEDQKKAWIKKEQELNLQIEGLKVELNKLALLFEEYIIAFKDQTKLLGVFVKNTNTVEAFLQSKLDAFNKGPEPKKEK